LAFRSQSAGYAGGFTWSFSSGMDATRVEPQDAGARGEGVRHRVHHAAVMSGDVLIGLVGVAAGALATGGVQALAAIARRRNDALAFARLVWNRLFTSTTAIEQMIEFDRWVGFPSFRRDLAVWDTERRALARSMRMMGFHAVSAAHNVLAVMEDRRSTARLRAEPDEGWVYDRAELEAGS
jgi:hypothetical protein